MDGFVGAGKLRVEMASQRKRKWIVGGLRLLVCCAALYWVAHNISFHDQVTLTDGETYRVVGVDGGSLTILDSRGVKRTLSTDRVARRADGSLSIEAGLRTTWRTADKTRLLLCLVVFAPVTLIQSLRFEWVLRVQGITVSYWESVKLCYAGNFLNFVTALGSTGGDVFKAYYVSLYTDRKTEAITTVMLDRIIGLLSVLIIVAVVICLRSGDSKLASLNVALAVIAIAGILGAALLFSERLRKLTGIQAILAKLPLATYVHRAAAATRHLAAHKRVVAAALATSCLSQMLAISSFVIAAEAVGMDTKDGKVWDYYAYLAGGVVVASVPISFQGLGTVEAFYKHVFLDTHGPLAALLCLAMAIRAIGLIWSLPGLVIMLTGACRPRMPHARVELADVPS